MPELVDTLKTIHLLHGTSAVLRIFAARRFPIAAALTRICFINPERSEVTEDELCATLDHILGAAREIGHEEEDSDRFQEDSKQYLEQWSNLRGANWFSVHADPSGLKYYRLTAAGREAHTILASIEAGRSVSTESRLKRFIDLTNDLSTRASGSPDRRIGELKTQIQRAEREIAGIERTGRVEVMPEREVIAEFEELLRLHGAIGTDLDQVRALMAQHRASTQDIVMTSEAPKGQLLDLVFVEEDRVRGTDEYASLDAFRQLLTDDQLRMATREKVEELKHHPVIHKRFIATGKAPARFDGAVESFFDRSRKIDAEFNGYYEQLRGIVVREDIDEMRAVSRTHKVLGARFVDVRDRLAPSPRDPRLKGIGIVLPGTAFKPHPTADIRFPANLAERAQSVPPADAEDDESVPDAFEREMRRQAHITRSQLKLRIALARKRVGKEAVRLSDVLSLFPLRYGLLELNAFIELAIQHVPSRFDPVQISVTRLIDEHEDPVGLSTCTFFDPIFLSRGEPGTGIEDVHCLVPENAAVDESLLLAIEQDGLEASLRSVIDKVCAVETMTQGEQ
ncbi:DUF3375 family protein [Pelagibius sp.]|uniref:DUF3375 family protein n=1 Tax=Pelagibius sp. TaxID=1931238 RepID=UPI003B500F4C